MSTTPTSTFTPLSELRLPEQPTLRDAFSGRKLAELRTPALVIDRAAFVANCAHVTAAATRGLGMAFRAHVKTHKTPQGTRLQVEAGDGVTALIASTMPEVWGILETGLVEAGKVTDILYSLPVSADRMEDLTDAQEKAGKGCTIRVMVDHALQVSALAEASRRLNRRSKWSVFVKVDGGGHRAGAPPRSEQMRELVEKLKQTPEVEVFGFYSHFGQSYASKDLDAAGKFYQGEIECVNDAATYARELGLEGPLVLSVGATPTAHAAVLGADGIQGQSLQGTLELHAGCYCVNDLQQLSTGVVEAPSSAALSVVSTVVSVYPDRKEAVCDAGALAVSKDVGPVPGYGKVVSHEGWRLGRVSQEHGVLTQTSDQAEEIKIGDKVRLIPQHACLACAGYPWFYIVDGGVEVVDVWVPWKGW